MNARDRYQYIEGYDLELKRSRPIKYTQPTDDHSFLRRYKLNKQKKYLLEEQRNTEIDRQNRILYEKIAKSKISYPANIRNSRLRNKTKTLPTQPNSPTHSRVRINDEGHQPSKEKTLFLGQNKIDGIKFKIKLSIDDEGYRLMARNEHVEIFLQMDEKQYWNLHYEQLQHNPCNIFKYLEIDKGRVQFRTKKRTKKFRLPEI